VRSLRGLIMARITEPNVLLRVSVLKPPAGVAHSLQDKDSVPVDMRMSAGKTLVFDIPARLEEGKTGWRFLGEHVRTEGKTRRFVYVAIGTQAGQTDTCWTRRAKVDLPEITPEMIAKAKTGMLRLDGSYEGTDCKGEPACATVNPKWSVR
jgi:hypothetical protein